MKNYFFSFWEFSGNSRQCQIVEIRTINLQNLVKIVKAICVKIEILNFLESELILILRVGRNGGRGETTDICERTLYIKFEREPTYFLASGNFQ